MIKNPYFLYSFFGIEEARFRGPKHEFHMNSFGFATPDLDSVRIQIVLGGLGPDSVWIHMVFGPKAQIPSEFIWFSDPGRRFHMNSYVFRALGQDSIWIHMFSRPGLRFYMNSFDGVCEKYCNSGNRRMWKGVRSRTRTHDFRMKIMTIMTIWFSYDFMWFSCDIMWFSFDFTWIQIWFEILFIWFVHDN